MHKILLIEDDLAIQDSFKMVFPLPEYEVETLSNGEQLLRNDYTVPDLIVLDKQLSGMDGVDLCRYLKKNPVSSQIPIVMISASPSALPLGKMAGADDVLMKPYRLADLRAIVGKYLNREKEATY